MGLNRLLQGIDLVDFDLELAGLEQPEQLIDVELKFLASVDVAKQGRTGDLDTFRGEPPAKRVSSEHQYQLQIP